MSLREAIPVKIMLIIMICLGLVRVETTLAAKVKKVKARVGVVCVQDVSTKWGNGAYPEGAVAGARMLEYAGAEPVMIDAQDIKNGALDKLDAVYFGGGYAVAYKAYFDPLADKIRKFVKKGGAYIGMCAGAYYACNDIKWEGTVYEYNLDLQDSKTGRIRATGMISDMTKNPDHMGLCNIRATDPDFAWNNQSFKVLYFLGPYFEKLKDKVDVVAVYDYDQGKADEKPAMIKYKYGKGRVFLSGPHPEYEETRTIEESRDWVIGDNYGDANLQGIPMHDPDSEWDLMADILAWLCPEKVVLEEEKNQPEKKDKYRAAVYAGFGTSPRVVWPMMKMLDSFGITPYAWDGYARYQVVTREWLNPEQKRFDLVVFPGGVREIMKIHTATPVNSFSYDSLKKFISDGGHVLGIGAGAAFVADELKTWPTDFLLRSPLKHGLQSVQISDPIIGKGVYKIALWTRTSFSKGSGWDGGSPYEPATYTSLYWTPEAVTKAGAVPVGFFKQDKQKSIAMVRYEAGKSKIFLSAVDPATEEGGLKDGSLWDNYLKDPESEWPLMGKVLEWMGLI